MAAGPGCGCHTSCSFYTRRSDCSAGSARGRPQKSAFAMFPRSGRLVAGSVGDGLAWRRSPLSSAGWRDVAAPPGTAGRDCPRGVALLPAGDPGTLCLVICSLTGTALSSSPGLLVASGLCISELESHPPRSFSCSLASAASGGKGRCIQGGWEDWGEDVCVGTSRCGERFQNVFSVVLERWRVSRRSGAQ